MFQPLNGVAAWPEHVAGEVRAFRADPDVIEERATSARALGAAEALAGFGVGDVTMAVP